MKKILNIILAVILLLSMVVTASAEDVLLIAPNPSEQNKTEFTDVDKNSVSGQAIYKLVEAGILLGDGNGKFRPDDPITRAELTKIVNSIFGYTEADTTGFSDVSESDWYYTHVLIAKKAGYIVGFGDGTFRGEEKVSREQACTILCRVANLYDLPIEIQINDEVSDWARPYVNKVLANALMTLEPNGTFRATKDITRAEFSTTYSSFYVPAPSEPEEKYEIEVIVKNVKADITYKVENGEIFITLADKFTLSSQYKTFVTVKKDGVAVSGIKVTVADIKDNKVTLTTNKDGKVEAKLQAAGGGGGGPAGDNGNTGGDNTGDNENTNPPAPDTPNYSELNSAIIGKLNKALTEIDKYEVEFTGVVATYKDCMVDIITKTKADATTKLITENYMKTTYASDFSELNTYYNQIKASESEKINFGDVYGGMNATTLKWIVDEFDIEYNVINYAMVKKLSSVNDKIDDNYGMFSDLTASLMDCIYDAIDETVRNSNAVIITANYVKNTYNDNKIAEAKGYYEQIKADPEEKSNFSEALGKFDTDELIWIAEQFGIDTENVEI